MSVNKEKLLQKNISELPFTSSITEALTDAGIVTLLQLMQWPIYQWQDRITGLTYPYVCEIICFVTDNNLHEYLKEE